MIYSHWLLLIFNGEFLLWLLALVVILIGLSYVFIMGIFTHWLVPILMAAALMGFGFKWSRQFLVRMIIDYDANNGDGRIIIQRLVPAPNLPETVQFPLQQAAEGSPEVNTKGVLNTLITQLKPLAFLRPLTIGDLTLRGPAAPFGITMYNIKDPGGVKNKLESSWKKILALKNKQKAEKEKQEEIERIKEGVRLGMQELLANLKPEHVPFLAPPALPAPDPVQLKKEEEAEEEGIEHLEEGEGAGEEGGETSEVEGQMGHGEEAGPGLESAPLGTTMVAD